MKQLFAVLCIGLLFSAPSALAADHQVRMLNKGSNGKPMQYEPAYLKIAPGDTVTFLSETRGHNVQSIKGMIPNQAEPFKSRLSKDVTLKFDEPGLYGYKCQPHYTLGMVGLIQVGDDPQNLAEFKSVKLRGKVKAEFAELLGQVKTAQIN